MKRLCVFKWFAAMASSLPENEMEPFLLPAINPLFRVAQQAVDNKDEAKVGSPPPTTTSQLVDAPLYVQAHSLLRTHNHSHTTGGAQVVRLGGAGDAV